MPKSLVQKARLKTALVFATVGSALAVSAPAMALTTDADTLIAAAYAAAEGSIGIVIAGMLGIALILCGFGIVYSMLKK